MNFGKLNRKQDYRQTYGVWDEARYGIWHEIWWGIRGRILRENEPKLKRLDLK